MKATLVFITFVLLLPLIAWAQECSVAREDSTVTSYYKTKSSGEGTYYGNYQGGGHCSLDPTPSFIKSPLFFTSVAISKSNYANSEVCGMCLNVTGTGRGAGGNPLIGNMIVYVNNECPECAQGDLDFALPMDGRWDISWTAIPCPVESNIQYIFQGSHMYYIKLQARNTRYPVQAISVKVGDEMKALKRTIDGFFELSAAFTLPLQVQVTSSFGQVITDEISSISNDVVYDGTMQFSSCDPTPDTTSSSTTSSTPVTQSTTSIPQTITSRVNVPSSRVNRDVGDAIERSVGHVVLVSPLLFVFVIVVMWCGF